MTYIVDNAPVGVEPMTDQERRDLADEREQEEYLNMFETVRKEWMQVSQEYKIYFDAPAVHREAMRRLKEKYAQE